MKNKKIMIPIISVVVVAIFVGLGWFFSCKYNLKMGLCQQTGTVMESKGANLEIKGDEKNSGYYKTIEEAWAKANEITDKDITITLNEDWIAKDGSFGSGTGFGETGAIKPVNRATQYSSLVIDLNNHTINRNLSVSKANGEVVNLQSVGYFTLKNGTVKGGNNNSNGGGFYIGGDKTNVKLSDMKVESNVTTSNGGGIYTDASKSKVMLVNVDICKNKSTDGFGGGIFVNAITDAENNNDDVFAQINLREKIVINNNEGKNDRNNLTLENMLGKAKINGVSVLKDGSEIFVGFAGNDNQGQVASIESEELLKYFKSDKELSTVIIENINKEFFVSLKNRL